VLLESSTLEAQTAKQRGLPNWLLLKPEHAKVAMEPENDSAWKPWPIVNAQVSRTIFRRTLGAELRQARKRCGLVRRELLEEHAAVLTVSEPTLGTYEQGTRSTSVDRFVDLCEALDVWAPDLLARAILQAHRFPLDLRLAAHADNLALAPMRRWAECRWRTIQPGRSTIVLLDQAAIRTLAELCGMSVKDLATALLPFRAQPATTRADDGRSD
jgi:transcriptional regulator with XRE-family HTH domain